MFKRSILLTATVAVTSPFFASLAAAQTAGSPSSVAIIGLVDVYAGKLQRSNEAGSVSAINSGGLNTSFWGFTGSEDLGNGLRAQFMLESFFQADTGAQGRNATDPGFSKNAWVGLSSRNWGTLRLGRQTNPLFLATGAANPFGTSLAVSPLVLHTWSPAYNRAVIGDSVWDNSVSYTTPTFSNLRLTAQHAFGEVAHRSGRNNTNLTLNYGNGPLQIVASAQRAKIGPGFVATIDSQNVAMAGLAYDFGAVRAFASTQRARTPNVGLTTKTTQLGATVPLGLGRIQASVARSNRDLDSGADTKRTTAALGYEHILSKRTDLYAVLLRDRLTGFSSHNSYLAGVRHRF